VAALLDAEKFHITILARPGSAILTTSPSFPATVRIVPVDFSSLPGATQALQGQDALICALPSSEAAVMSQTLLIAACIAAGVSLFLPSEFGSDTDNPLSRALPLFAPKVRIQQYLEAVVRTTPEFGYTLVRTGIFLDRGLVTGLLLDVRPEGGEVEIYGHGDRVASATAMSTIGQAVVAILERPDACRNRAVYIHDIALSQRQVLGLVRRLLPRRTWEEKGVDLVGMETAVLEGRGQPRDNLKLTVWATGYGGCFEKLDNELLGIKGKSLGDIEEMIKVILKV
jgi:hypothetical protein